MAAKPGKTILDLLKANINSKRAAPSKKGSCSKVSTAGTDLYDAETVGCSQGDNSAPSEDRDATSNGIEALDGSNVPDGNTANSSAASNVTASIEPELLLPTFLKWKGAAKVYHPHNWLIRFYAPITKKNI
jgi:hypothetical protein